MRSDDEIRRAIRESTSWRGVTRALGYHTNNKQTVGQIRRRGEELGLDVSHFRGQRTWSDQQLARAVTNCTSWTQVLEHLELYPSGTNRIAVKARAKNLGFDYSHIEHRVRAPSGNVPFTNGPRLDLLRSAAPSLASAWFIRRGYMVSHPAEPCPYDLAVEADGILYRVQVKSATAKDRKSSARVCRLAQNPRYRKTVLYDPDDIDFFFIVTADNEYYIVPIEEVAGQGSVSLSTLGHRRVPT